MTPDPALQSIRDVRRKISADANHDVASLLERYRQMQATFKGRVLPGPEASPNDRQAKQTDSDSPPDQRSAG